MFIVITNDKYKPPSILHEFLHIMVIIYFRNSLMIKIQINRNTIYRLHEMFCVRQRAMFLMIIKFLLYKIVRLFSASLKIEMYNFRLSFIRVSYNILSLLHRTRDVHLTSNRLCIEFPRHNFIKLMTCSTLKGWTSRQSIEARVF